MKHVIIASLTVLFLFGTFVSFQKPTPQQFMVVAEYSKSDNNYICYWWDSSSKQSIKLVGVYELIKYANSFGLKIVSSYAIPMNRDGIHLTQIVFIIE